MDCSFGNPCVRFASPYAWFGNLDTQFLIPVFGLLPVHSSFANLCVYGF
uniref:Uncharacterized protein n=1 Tax=Anguilla anguilla TaxID=7936 RepID=A0A0E9S1C1_ANGAN